MNQSGAPAEVGLSDGLGPDALPFAWWAQSVHGRVFSAMPGGMGLEWHPLYTTGWPEGWQFSRNANGSITITNNDGMGVVVCKNAQGPREIPEEVLHALAVALGA